MPVREALRRAAACLSQPAAEYTEPLSCGVDLGTATCVLAVIDGRGVPIYVDQLPSRALRDGVVVDFHGAAATVARLKASAEEALGRRIDEAATAYPLEQAGLSCTELVDEVSAANRFLGIDDGVIVDVGGGSTGVGVYSGGRLVKLGDRPGGGHHLDLILAGTLKVTIEDAERLKRENGEEYLRVLRPGIERIATSISILTDGHSASPLHLAGGALMLPGAAEIIASYLERPVLAYEHALLITPLGIAGRRA
ncbi:MAG: ethanolamine utilization protein EutJ [Chloroflexi bacterium]|nr:MAG: ethanolamine utilization protein EutJ [Chloroflexota bacterium]